MKTNPSAGFKSGSRDQIEGTAKKLSGIVKEGAGKALGNENLKEKGASEQAEGKLQNKIGEIKKVFDL